MTDPDNPDYITVQHVPDTRLFVVRHIRWDRVQSAYIVHTQGRPMVETEAKLTARMMAGAIGLEYRP